MRLGANDVFCMTGNILHEDGTAYVIKNRKQSIRMI